MGEVETGKVDEPEGAHATDDAEDRQPTGGARRRWIVAGGAALLIVVGAGVAYLISDDGGDGLCETLDRPIDDVGRFGQLLVFLEPDASEAEIDRVEDILVNDLEMTEIEWVDQQEAFEEFQAVYADDSEMLASVSPEVLPPSFRATPVGGPVTSPPPSLESAPGVFRVVVPDLPPAVTTLDVIEFAFASRQGGVPHVVERQMWRLDGDIDELFAAIDLGPVEGVDRGVAADLETISEAIDDIANGVEPDSAVHSATDRMIVAHAEQCDVT